MNSRTSIEWSNWLFKIWNIP